MHKPVELKEKYERNGWPALTRPDLKSPPGWSLSLVTSLQRIRSHMLSPDGQWVAYIMDSDANSDVYIIPAAGGWPQRLSTDRAPVPYWNDEIPQWSPDGRWLAFGIDGHVHVLDAAGGLPQKVTDFTAAASAPRWMPDSHGLVVTVERKEVDQLLLTDRTGCWPRSLTDDSLGDHWDVRPGPDGAAFLFTLRRFDDLNRTDICRLDGASGQVQTLYGRPGVRAWNARWRPDGQMIAFISQENGHDDLWLAAPDGSKAQQVTHQGYDISAPAWRPDGKAIVFLQNRGGAFDLCLLEVDSGQVRELRRAEGIHANPCWSPAGDFLTFEYESPLLPPDIYRLELASMALTQLTFSRPPALARLLPVMPERVSYRSLDGLEIPALLLRPAQPNGAALVYVHGGPSSQSCMEWDVWTQYLVAKGYTVLEPNYRGSTGYGVAFEHANYGDWGKRDTQDILYAARYLHTLDGIDRARIAVLGGSYGGYMTICSLALDPEYLYACGISKFGDSNLYSSWALCNRELRLYTEVFLGSPGRNRQAYLDGSPVTQADKVRRPLLILHGLEDDIVPPEASEEWVEALKRHDKVFEYKTYAREPHGFLRRENMLDAYVRMERFLDWYLMPAGK